MSTKITSPVVQALETSWAALQRRYPELPDVAITIGDGTRKGGDVRGHFWASQWEQEGTEVHEVFMAGQRLKDGPEGVMATLVHEAAHAALSHARGTQDTSRQGHYHNARFRATAEELGLKVTQRGNTGWSGTELTDEARKMYRADLVRLGKVIVAHRRAYGTGTKAAKSKSNNGVSAECGCGRKLRMSVSAWEQGPVTCGTCGQEFQGGE